ncbi:pantoate--beta-alanine ligase [Candidatus Methylospira mobilis]|uniref:Pantothenate synthetase n=1 Tax=Candidatus Methylospira mobilis TaxID=1808979 RepID=A0A5Q0BBY5_9GAMM|nr:pantoate--beta-alanine ligase [Candidatus Methylospira mobilis]QFY41453.1 pantoate--beta-alanine ligase [Candidatus Methylospira mobilis]
MFSSGLPVVTTGAVLRGMVSEWRQTGLRIGFVPTMGNLHAGHFRLVQRARQLADRVVVSIFVNPSQFGPGEDYASYPRTFEADRAGLGDHGADLLFYPAVAEIYPRPFPSMTQVEVPGLSDILCGAVRPGHFRGVTTVVCKLLNLVQPDVALFGQKDYQQLGLIRQMVDDLSMQVAIEGVPTVREADGLALSSRNQYLSLEERSVAPLLFECLQQAAKALIAGERDWPSIESEQCARLCASGFRPDYFSIRSAHTLEEPDISTVNYIILVAARLGKARLIDNLAVTVS